MNYNIGYVSPSSIPSYSANSVHVVMQCVALLNQGVELSLFANRSLKDKENLNKKITDTYGFDLSNVNLVTFHARIHKFLNLRIAIYAFFKLLLGEMPEKVISRNLYYSFFHAIVLRKPLVFETHQIEYGFRKGLQKLIMTRSWVKTIVISKKLEEILAEEHGVYPYQTTVLPDAAPDGLLPAEALNRTEKLFSVTSLPKGNWSKVCGYFGQLYEGRGIEIIEDMALNRPDILFLVYGGEPSDVSRCREKNSDLPNIFFGGHVSHPEVQQLMRCVDFLLMPYQAKVSIGVSGHDTGRWMSPMKMFEYMAAGVPIISSDLPALREILTNGKNALLVSPSEPKRWCEALDLLINEAGLSESIGTQAHLDYRQKYTWGIRAQAILSLFD